jgi:hypothetical protein
VRFLYWTLLDQSILPQTDTQAVTDFALLLMLTVLYILAMYFLLWPLN